MLISESESYIINLIFSRYKLKLDKLEESKIDNIHTPDYLCLHNNKKLFVCELKELIFTKPDKNNGWNVTEKQDGSVSAYRNSNIARRLYDDIRDAIKKFNDFDDQDLPRVLIFLNKDLIYACINDLLELLQGYSIGKLNDGKEYLYISSDTQKKLNNIEPSIFNDIDLYIWIECGDKITIQFVGMTDKGNLFYHNYFKKQ